MREYGLANSLYWALAEGHACEQSARRNAMDVGGIPSPKCHARGLLMKIPAERLQERRRDDHQVPDSVQPYPTGRHHRRAGRDHHWCHCLGGHVNKPRCKPGSDASFCINTIDRIPSWFPKCIKAFNKFPSTTMRIGRFMDYLIAHCKFNVMACSRDRNILTVPRGRSVPTRYTARSRRSKPPQAPNTGPLTPSRTLANIKKTKKTNNSAPPMIPITTAYSKRKRKKKKKKPQPPITPCRCAGARRS